MLTLLLACGPSGPAALVADDRSAHLLDRPFPAMELMDDDGTVDLSAFPNAGSDLGDTMVQGWARQASETSMGFGHLGPIAFRFEAPLEGLEDRYTGLEDDPVRLYSLDSDHRVPIDVRFVESAQGDPFLRDNTLLIAPIPTAPLRSGERYIAVVDTTLASPSETYVLPDQAPDDAAVATVFPVQDSVGQLLTLGAATDAALDADPTLLQPAEYKRVASLRYEQGETPSGNAATVVTVTFEDDTTELSYLDDVEGGETWEQDLLTDWPFAVYQIEIQTLAFQDLSAQPYASPGLGLIGDFGRSGDGWIPFTADGALVRDPVPESMRVVVQVPVDATGPLSVMTWDHGTGGHAYNALRRVVNGHHAVEIAQALADAGVVVVSRDQPLYGTRYPLIDEGHSASLGFYNIGNLPAFRDNQRQAAVDHRVLHRFVRDELPSFVETTGGVGAFGHSLGSVTVHLGAVLEGNDGADDVLVSGTGGYFTYYVLETGLLGSGNAVVEIIAPLTGFSEEDLLQASPSELIAALMGVPEAAWPGMDRMHPAMGLFQMIMDPSDAISTSAGLVTPETIVLGVGDYQVPNITTDWLAEVLPAGSDVVVCEPRADYDPHHCTYIEPEGIGAMEEWASGL